MSSCLNDARLQAAADGEATQQEIEHVRTCPACARRVRDVREAMNDFAQKMSAVPVPPRLESRVAVALSRPVSERRGATTLRARGPQRRTWLVAGGALAAAVIAIVFVLLPSVDPGTRLNASAILNRSLETLAVEGTELLRYELSIEAPTAAPGEAGTFLIEQLVDHQTGRWRFSRFAPDGTLLSGIAEDPVAKTREAIVVMDGQTYHFRFNVPSDQRVPLWDLQRRYAETMIHLVQASGAQVVTTDQGPDGALYVVELPAADRPTTPSPFELDHARVVVDASDFHIIEFTAAGAVMGERGSIGYRLIARDIEGGQRPAADFALGPRDLNAIELEGDGTRELPRDLLTLLLREVAHARR